MKKGSIRFLLLLLCISASIVYLTGCASQGVDRMEDYKRMLNSDIEIDASELKANFKNNPEKHSQATGEYLLKQFYEKNSDLGREMIELPDIRDGVSHEEVIALQKIYNIVEPLDVPEGFMQQKENPPIHRIKIEWSSNEYSDWSGTIQYGVNYPHYTIFNVRPILFEPEDSINHELLDQQQKLSWSSKIGGDDDYDGILLDLEYPINKVCSLDFQKSDGYVFFKFSDLVKQGNLVFGKEFGINGNFKISYLSEKRTLEQFEHDFASYAIREIIRLGAGDNYSPGLEALLWAAMDGKLADCPLSKYTNVVDYVKPIWGNMDGSRWDNFSISSKRLSTPELINMHQLKKYSYATTYEGYGCGGVDISVGATVCSPSYIFSTKKGNCAAFAVEASHHLKNAGIESYIVKIRTKWPASIVARRRGILPGDYHYLVVYKGKDKKWYTIDNGSWAPNGIKGPYETREDLPYKILGFEKLK
jgi:hypothetical protein